MTETEKKLREIVSSTIWLEGFCGDFDPALDRVYQIRQLAQELIQSGGDCDDLK